MVDERWLTVSEIALLLRVSPKAVRDWLRSGRLAGVNLGGRTGWRVRESALEAFLEGSEAKAAA